MNQISLIIIIVICIVSNVTAQSNRLLDSTLCYKLSTLANSKIDKDSIIITSYTHRFSKTEMKIFELKYGFNYPLINSGDVIPNEMSCFDKVMDEYILKKQGVNFYEKIREEADSLDELNHGYIEPKLLKYTSLEECFIQNWKQDSIFEKNKDLLLLISFEIDTAGSILNPSFYASSLFGGNLSILTDEVLINELNRICQLAGNYEPARFYNYPIAERRSLFLYQNLLKRHN